MSNAKLSKQFWGEAFQISSHLVNKIPASAIDSKTHNEVWFRKATGYSHLRVFGCVGFVHMSEGKPQVRSKKCIFLGYIERVKGIQVMVSLN